MNDPAQLVKRLRDFQRHLPLPHKNARKLAEEAADHIERTAALPGLEDVMAVVRMCMDQYLPLWDNLRIHLVALYAPASPPVAPPPAAADVTLDWQSHQLERCYERIAALQATVSRLEGENAQLTKERDDWKEGSEMHLRMYDNKRQLANSLTAQLSAAQQQAEAAEAYKTRWHSLTGWILDRLAAGEIYCKGNYEAWKAGLGVAYDRIKELDPNVIADMDAAPPAAEPVVPRPAMEKTCSQCKSPMNALPTLWQCTGCGTLDAATGETP